MNSKHAPAQLVELWIRLNGEWHPLETLDPSAPEFSSSPVPFDYACFVARRLGRHVMTLDRWIEGYQVRQGRGR